MGDNPDIVDRCPRCGHEWQTITGDEPPTRSSLSRVCPKCKSPYWNRPRKMDASPSRRVDVRAILMDPVKRRDLMVQSLMALQHREGIMTTREQAERAYDKVQQELNRSKEVADAD